MKIDQPEWDQHARRVRGFDGRASVTTDFFKLIVGFGPQAQVRATLRAENFNVHVERLSVAKRIVEHLRRAICPSHPSAPLQTI